MITDGEGAQDLTQQRMESILVIHVLELDVKPKGSDGRRVNPSRFADLVQY